MATSSMFSSISQAPLGLQEEDGPDVPDLEIEIDNPDAVSMSDGSMEITLIPEDSPASDDFDANLAEEMDQGDLQMVASDLLELIDADISSRKDWVEAYVKGLEVLGMKYE